MNTNRPSFLDIANFQSAEGLDMGRPVQPKVPGPVEEKKARLTQASQNKKAMFGSPEEKRVLATAVEQGNDLGDEQFLQDLRNGTYADLTQKYGPDVAENRYKFIDEVLGLREFKARERTNEDTAKDSLIDFGKMAVNTVGGAAAAGAAGVDAVAGSNLSPGISQGLEWFNEQANASQSDLMQARREQHVLEAELDSQDRQAKLQKDVAENPDSFMPGLKNIGRAFMDTVDNYTDDPIMAGALVPEGIGSLAPSTAAIKVVSKARAISKLMKGGRSRKEALDHLNTEEGRDLLNQEALLAAPAVLGASEAGAGVTQTQQEIMGMSPEQLMEYDVYRDLIDSGLTHEEAVVEFATGKGIQAGALALPGALAAGRISAPFAAAPLTSATRKGAGSTATRAGRNVASEAVEETLQEANTQAASNVALERPIEEGVGEAGGQGFVGGVATAGALQAPGAAAGTLAETARGIGAGASAAVNAREESQKAREDAASPVGTNARKEASDRAVAAGDQLQASLDQTTPNQTTPETEDSEPTAVETTPVPKKRIDLRELKDGPVEPKQIADVTNAANYLTQEEVDSYTPMFPELAEQKDTSGRIRRSDFIEAAGVLMESEDEVQVVDGAIAILDGLNDLQKADSKVISDALKELPPEHPAVLANAALRESIDVTMASPVVKKAREIIGSMTEEGMKMLTDVDVLTRDNVDEDVRQGAMMRTRVVAQTNPGLLDQAGYDVVLNQTTDPAQKRLLQTARRASGTFKKAQELKESITYGSRPTVDIVREEIETGGNSSNAMPSLTGHYRKVMDAVLTGQTEVGTEALEDLRSFALSQNNKIQAYNESANDGGKKKTFEAFGPYKFFEQTQYKPFADVTNANSVALAQEAMIDAQSVSGLYNLLRAAYGDELGFGGAPLKTPNLDIKIRNAAKGFSKAGVTPDQTTPAPKTSDQTRRAARPERKLRKDARVKTEDSLIEQEQEQEPEAQTTTQPEPQSQAETRKDDGDDQARIDESQADQEREADTGSEQTTGEESSSESSEAGTGRDTVQSEPGREAGEKLGSERVAIYPVVTDRLESLSNQTLTTLQTPLDEEIQSELDDVGSLLDLLGITTNKEEDFSVRPQNKDIVRAQRRLFEIYQDVKANPGTLEKRKEEIQQLFQWFKNKNTEKDKTNKARIERARKSATKYGNGNPEAHFILQLVEELGEVIEENTSESISPVIKRALKALRFGPSTVNKSSGLTNQQELEQVISEEAVSDPVTSGINHTQAWFKGMGPNFVNSAKNRFLKSFRPNKDGSALLAHEDPASFIQENLKNLVTEENGLQVELTEEQRESLEHLVQNLVPEMAQSFETRMLETAKEKGWLAKLDEEDSPVLRYQNGLPMNFMVRDPDNQEDIKFENRVLQATMMASLEWVIEAQTKGRPVLKDEQVAIRLGLPRDTRVTDNMRTAAQSGEMLQSGLRDISARIKTLLGVETKSDMPSNLTQGIFQSLASNALSALKESEILKINEKKFTHKDKTKTIKTLSLAYRPSEPNTTSAEALAALSGVSDVFAQIFTSSSEKTRYVGVAPTKVSPTVIRNQMAPLSETEKTVIEKLQQVSYKVNGSMLSLADMLGDDLFAKILGFQETENTKFNVNHLESVKGKNTALTRGFQGFRAYLEEAQNYADAKGIPLSEVPIHFDYKFSSVGRLQQVGPITPQGDKIMRELVTVTNAVIDVTDPASDQTGDLWLAVAQSLDVSIDKLFRENAIAEAQLLVQYEGKLAPAVAILKEGITAGEIPAAAQKRLAETLKESGEPITMKTIHALQTVARLELAREEGGDALSQFETSLAMEADGVTDGPINALVHMYTGDINDWYLDTLAKGGWFFKGDTRTRNEQFTKDPEDLYNAGAKIFDRNLADDLENMDPLERENALKVYSVLDALLKGFRMEYDNDGNVTFFSERGEVKNPLTVMIYGSSQGGVAKKITSSLLDKLYETLSEIAQSERPWQEHPLFAENPDLANQINELLNTKYTTEGGVVKNFSQAFGSDILSNPEESGFTQKSYDNLVSHIEEFFAKPMFAALDEATGGVTANMQVAQKASQVQYLVFAEKFEKAMKARRQELAEQGVLDSKINEKTGAVQPVEMLSEDEIKRVFAETSKFAPIYETDAHEFHISAKESFNSDEIISQDFSGQLAGASVNPSPAEPSVKVSPYMTIGTGDGRMILNIYANGDGDISATLPVFDGVEIGVNQIREASAHINEQVFQGWMMDNAFQSITDGYRQMFNNLDLNTLTDGTKAEIGRALGLKKGDTLDQRAVASLGADLRDIADKIQARKNAMKSVPSRTDHMAGAGAPYEHTVEGEQALTDYGLVQLLQKREAKELKKIQDKRQEARKRPTTQKPSAKALEAVEKLGTEVEGYESVRQIRGSDLNKLVTKETGASRDQLSVMGAMAQGNAMKTLSNFTVFTGSPEELNQLKKAEYAHLDDAEIQEGQAWVGSEVIFLNNVSTETVVHEALHAATYRTIKDYYDDPEGAPQAVQNAVKRMRALASDFMKLNPESQPKNIRESMQRVRAEMSNTDLSDAQKMSEFISWTLSNQNLIELGQNVRVRNPLAAIVEKAIRALQTMLGIQTKPGKNLFENVRFNADILASVPNKRHTDRLAVETDQLLEQRYPGTDRLKEIERQYMGKLTAYLESMRDWRPEVKAKAGNEVTAAWNRARTASEQAIANGFAMNPRQAHAFEAVHHTLMSGMKLDPGMMRKAMQMYRHTVSKLNAEDFADDSPSVAAMKADFLTSTSGLRKDREGNSDLLATFMALAQVDDSLRAVLGDMAPPKSMAVKHDTVDGFLRSLANAAVELLARLSLSRQKQSKTVQAELDRLSDSLTEVQGERAYMATLHKLGRGVNAVNDQAAATLSSGTKRAVGAIQKLQDSTTNPKAKTALSIAKGITSLGDKDASTATGETLTQMMNDMPNGQALRSLLSDVRGATESNTPLLRLINLVRAKIDAVRQDYREGVPRELEARFSRTLSREEWSQLFMGLGRADLMAFKRPEVMELLKNQKMADSKIQELEEKIQGLGGKFAPRYLEKAEALATYMMTRKVISNNLQRNAHSIARLAGEQGNQKKAIEKIATPELMQAIEQLTSLYAFQKLEKPVTQKLADLVQNEEVGMRTLIGTLQAARDKEQQRRSQQGKQGDVPLKNGWQGYVPSLTAEGASVIVADVSEETDLKRRGYVRIGDYQGDRRSGYKGKRAYYQSTVSGRNAFRQGIAQTVHESYQGVDTRTGRNKSEETGGLVLGQRSFSIARDLQDNGSRNNLPAGEYLLPIYDANDNVSGFEESLDPDKLVGLQKDQHLGRMLGVWLGRIEEESLAHEANRELLETLQQTYKKEYALNPGAFVNVADKKLKDKVYRDAWDTLGWKIKEDAAEVFGRPDFLPIRKDMIDDAIGYRSASITDAWTGISRLKPEQQEQVKRAAILILGTDAYKRMKQGEKIVQDAVSYAKSTIIVRSIKVAWENILSNVAHLMAMGIDPITAAKGMRSKFLEVTQYTKNLEEIQKLHVDLAGAFDNKRRQDQLEAQIQALEDTNARLSIAPLIEAGEFSTISEDLTETDVAIREGKWGDYLEKATERLPGWGQSAGKNLLMTKDSATFQGLNRMVQYGDFIAKAIVYDHLTQKKQNTHREALDVVLEEFVQYNRLPGRVRDGLESHGLLWFFNYKLRIMKIAVKTLRDRPVSALFMFGGFGPSTGIDTVVDGSLPGTIERGTIGYAFGPEMGINAPFMHPILDLTN